MLLKSSETAYVAHSCHLEFSYDTGFFVVVVFVFLLLLGCIQWYPFTSEAETTAGIDFPFCCISVCSSALPQRTGGTFGIYWWLWGSAKKRKCRSAGYHFFMNLCAD